MKIFHSAVLAATLLAGANALADSAPPYQVVVTRLGVSTTTFSCTGAGQCNYLLVNSLCQERMLDTATKERNCRYTEAARFTLIPGQTKTVPNLPADYLYTMKMNSVPSVDDVVKSPVAH